MKEKGLRILKTIIITIISVYLTNTFNIFCYVSFLSQDQAFDTCLAVYLTILEVISELLMDIFRKNFMSSVSAILYLNDMEPSINSAPVIKFNDFDLAEVMIAVQISGRKKRFKNSKIILSNGSFTTMQANVRDSEVAIDNNGNYIINLEKMFGTTNKKTSLSSSFRITFTKEPIDGERTIEICPELKNTFPFGMTFKYNKAILKIER